MASHPTDAVVLAEVSRSGFVEGVHSGHAVIVSPHGDVVESWGDPNRVIFPRSSNKPAQATALVNLGLDLPPHLLALAAASHSGEQIHLDAVREILGGAGLTEADLQTPPDFPLDEVERDSWIVAGREAVPIAMNCSGKHASMLATCVINGWQIKNYRDPSHPLQLEIVREVERCAGEPIRAIGVDGCGAPVLAISLAGLARSVSRLVQGDEQSSGRRVVDAMRAWPQQVGGSRRDVTEFMRAVPGLVAKDGAEGVYVGAFPDGRAFAVKMEDGADRGRTVTVAALLTRMGADPRPLGPLATVPLLGGGVPVGRVASVLAG